MLSVIAGLGKMGSLDAYVALPGVHPCWAHQTKKKPQSFDRGFFGYKSLTMSYFHTGTRTIIGADAFHCPVRDGKEWYHVAMVIRHNFLFH